MEILFVLPAFIGALIATGLFFYGLYHIVKGFSFGERLLSLAKSLGLIRASDNPIIVRSGHSWEAHGVMNPAAVRAGGRESHDGQAHRARLPAHRRHCGL